MYTIKRFDKKRSNIIFSVIFLIVFIILGIGIYFLCYHKNEAKNLSLNKTEKKFVGEWELSEIAITSFFNSGSSYSQKYPSSGSNQYAASSSAFNTMCEKYYGKTKFIFDDKKFKNVDVFLDERIKGTLIIGDETINFYWYSEYDNNAISIDNGFYQSVCEFGVINGKNEINRGFAKDVTLHKTNELKISVNGFSHSSDEPSNMVFYTFKKLK